MFIFPQNPYVETLSPDVMVLRDGAFRWSLKLDKVMGWNPKEED